MWTSLLGAKVINRNFQCGSRTFQFSIIEGFLLLAPHLEIPLSFQTIKPVSHPCNSNDPPWISWYEKFN